MTTYELLRRSIEERKQVVGSYRGLRREFCSQVLGLSGFTKRVLVFQFGGATSDGTIVSPATGVWRCFDVDGIGSPRMRDGPWYTGPSETQDQHCIQVVEIDVRSMTGPR